MYVVVAYLYPRDRDVKLQQAEEWGHL